MVSLGHQWDQWGASTPSPYPPTPPLNVVIALHFPDRRPPPPPQPRHPLYPQDPPLPTRLANNVWREPRRHAGARPHHQCQAHRPPPRQASRLPHRPICAARATVAARHLDAAVALFSSPSPPPSLVPQRRAPAIDDRAYDDGPRYGLAAADVLITLTSWLHHRTQPYAYRFQNAVESWLYAATVVFQSMIIYRRSREHTDQLAIGWYRPRALGSTRCGHPWCSCADAAELQSIDFGEALAAADAKLDASIRERLADGTILLLKCDWLLN